MVGEYLEEVYCRDLLLVLGAAVEDDVLAVGRQLEDGLADVLAAEVGDHAGVNQQYCGFIFGILFLFLHPQGLAVVADYVVHLLLLLFLQRNHLV